MRRGFNNTQKAGKPNKKQYEFKMKLDKKKIIAICISIVVIVGIIVVNNYTSLGLVLNKNIDSKDSIEIELKSSNNKVTPFGNEILVYNSGTIAFYNNYGRLIDEIKLEDNMDAEIVTSGKYIQVINKAKGLVYIYKNKYEIARIKIEGEIYSGSINNEGTSVIEYSSNGNKTELGVYNNSGEKQYNIKLGNNIIGKYVLSQNSNYLAYIDVNVSGISAQTNINLIDLSNVKEDTTNTNVIHTSDKGLAYDIFWEGKSIITRFEESFVIYDAACNKKQIVEIDDGQLIDIGNYAKRFAYTKLNESGNYVLKIRKMTSDSLKTVPLVDATKYFAYEQGIVYVCYTKKIEAYNNLGMKIKSYNSDMVITEPVIFNNGKSVAMLISNKIIMFTI